MLIQRVFRPIQQHRLFRVRSHRQPRRQHIRHNNRPPRRTRPRIRHRHLIGITRRLFLRQKMFTFLVIHTRHPRRQTQHMQTKTRRRLHPKRRRHTNTPHNTHNHHTNNQQPHTHPYSSSEPHRPTPLPSTTFPVGFLPAFPPASAFLPVLAFLAPYALRARFSHATRLAFTCFLRHAFNALASFSARTCAALLPFTTTGVAGGGGAKLPSPLNISLTGTP